jgi:hypothetical protein
MMGAMAIVITRVCDLYEATITPPHCGGERWATSQPMPRHSVIAALRDRGCHQTDIGDAFYDADPERLLRP